MFFEYFSWIKILTSFMLVGQSWLTSPFTTLRALFASIPLIWNEMPDMVDTIS
jgi:hypothetical protein